MSDLQQIIDRENDHLRRTLAAVRVMANIKALTEDPFTYLRRIVAFIDGETGFPATRHRLPERHCGSHREHGPEAPKYGPVESKFRMD